MCTQTLPHTRRSKSSRRSSNPKQQKPSKHLKTKHICGNNCNNSSSSSSSSCNHNDSSSSSLDCSSRSRKSVSFNEVVNVRALHEQQQQRKSAAPQPPRRKKSVSFHEVVMVRPVLHLADYTDQEMYASWFVLEDKQQIKVDILNTLKLVRDGNFQGCTRGLEKLSDGGRTRERRLLSIREVLEEQEHQRKVHKSKNTGGDIVYDASKFRKAYKPHSRAARHVAHAVGKIDEMAAACQRVEIPVFGSKKRKN